MRDEDGLFIEYLSTDVAARLRIAHANDLAGRAVFQRFDFHRDAERPVLHQRVRGLTAADDGTGFDRPGRQR